jgi:F-type H+-transporting ATPase subunit delta
VRLTARQYATALVDLLDKQGSSEAFAGNFLTTLRKNRQERLLPRILSIAREVWQEKHRESTVIATVAQTLSPELQTHLESRLSKELGKKVTIQQHVDPTVKGGVSLRVGDDLYDGTLRGRLEAFKRQLTTEL